MIAAIIQARMSSSRLPGKVLKQIIGKPMLALQLERVARSVKLDKIIVATSGSVDDDAINEYCAGAGVACFRGSLGDVLDRYRRAAQYYNADCIVRLTGDCPLVDPDVIDHVIDVYQQAECDYASNTIDPTYPDGLDVEVFSRSALELAWEKAELPSEREHVTPYIKKSNDLKKLNVRGVNDLSALRWTVDDVNDFELATKVFEALYASNPNFRTDDILSFLAANPAVSRLNASALRDEGYAKSVADDKLHQSPTRLRK